MRTSLRPRGSILACGLAVLGQASASVAHPCPEHLFVIERSKNSNIVVYDANRGNMRDLVVVAVHRRTLQPLS